MNKCNIFLFFLFALTSHVFGQTANHYEVKTSINLQTKELSATARITFRDTLLTDTLKFYLLADLKISAIHITNGKLISTQIDTVKTYLQTIKILRTGDMKPVDITVSYAGKIVNKHITFGVGCIDTAWTELSDYVKWVPLEIHNPLFTYRIKVYCDNNYQVSGYGVTQKIKAGTWVISNTNSSYRMAIFASNQWYHQMIQTGKLTVNVYCAKGPDSLTNDLLAQIPRIIKLYDNRFGQAAGTFNLFYRNKDMPVNYTSWAYAATGFVSLYHIQNKSTLFLTLAHELAHNWWHNGRLNTTDEFLSEAFAEYSALMAYREFYPAKFIKRYESFVNKSHMITSVSSLQSHPDDRYDIIYVKGSVLLFELEKRIGLGKFIALLKIIKEKKIATIAEFNDLLEQMDGKQERLKFQTDLDN